MPYSDYSLEPLVVHPGREATINQGATKTLLAKRFKILYRFDADYYPRRDILILTAYFIDPEVGAVQGE